MAIYVNFLRWSHLKRSYELGDWYFWYQQDAIRKAIWSAIVQNMHFRRKNLTKHYKEMVILDLENELSKKKYIRRTSRALNRNLFKHLSDTS